VTTAVAGFQEKIWEYYRAHGRDLPWRHDPSPYQVVVSEMMLQQTQVARVLERYPRWLQRFAGWQSLASAPTREVLREWQGMGYNRRALYLQQIARVVVDQYEGHLPTDPSELVKLPGIGANTAGSIVAFAFNAPVIFIETNIRRVFIHEFFAEAEDIHDRQLLPLIEQALDREHPREWYYALMDYGAHQAKTGPNPNRRSRHYASQSKFEGSDRQLRGQILRALLEHSSLTAAELRQHLGQPEVERVDAILHQLTAESFLKIADGSSYRLVD
jgi:A/G-specific adenine glycosylase